MTMKIYIPTYMRETRQTAIRRMPEEIRSMVTLVTHSGRADILRENHPTMNIIDLGKTDGIADVRQKLFDRADTNKIMIIDDQCRFRKRNVHMKYETMTADDYRKMFSLVEQNLDSYAMVGVSDRSGNNRLLNPTKECTRMYSVYGINREMWTNNGITFDGMYRKNHEIKLYEDFYAVLSMLTKGMKNLLLCEYIFESTHGIPGGNSIIRNGDLQLKCIDALMQEFPEFVKKQFREDSSWVTDGDQSGRWEARIAWQEAFKSSQKNEEPTLEGLFG